MDMKKKNQKFNKKKREINIPIKITEETGYNVTFKFENGKGLLIDSYGKKLPLHKGVSTSYQGENKHKIVNTVFADNIYLDATSSVTEFEKLLVVDTNTKQVNNIKIAIGIMILCDISVSGETFKITPTSLLSDCFPDYWSQTSPFQMQYENYMWSNFLSIIRDEIKDYFHGKIAMVVDSDLGNLPNYNDHKTVFFNGLIRPCINPIIVLPENIRMFYAKSDKPNDSVLNNYISCCDDISNKLFAGIMARLDNYETKIIDRNIVLQEYNKEKEELNVYFVNYLKNKGLLI
jgi:hypothetical protein